MMLTDQEMNEVRACLETQAGWDAELRRRCTHLVHLGAFDEAVRSAFVLLEERLREALNVEGITGTNLALGAFDPEKGHLAKHLGVTKQQRQGLQDLYVGAFRLFRNPSAHGVVGYSPREGRAILALVDLLLGLLTRIAELPPPGALGENVEKLLGRAEPELGPGASSRLRVFLDRCMDLGLVPAKDPTQSIPFRRHALYKPEWWESAKPHRVGVFRIEVTRLLFVKADYGRIVGFDVPRLVEDLTELGFRPFGKAGDPVIDLRASNSQAFLDGLLALIVRIGDEFEESLQRR